jgi:hypothetical protein
MHNIPFALPGQLEAILRDRAVPNNAHGSYRKWMRYYPDFCQKYQSSESKQESLGQFLRKLEEKHQTKAQQQEASHAVSLYYDLINRTGSADELGSPQKVIPAGKPPHEPPSPSAPFSKQVAGYQKAASQRQTSKGTPRSFLNP